MKYLPKQNMAVYTSVQKVLSTRGPGTRGPGYKGMLGSRLGRDNFGTQ